MNRLKNLTLFKLTEVNPIQVHDLAMRCMLDHGVLTHYTTHKGYVASDGINLLGFLTYKKFTSSRLITRIGVLPAFRRQGIGSRLVRKLRNSTQTMCYVSEYNLPAQCFFRSLGFTALNCEGKIYTMLRKVNG